ncbi:MAG: tetratricopeptide repeat protein, partial [Actinomycetota bacterium]
FALLRLAEAEATTNDFPTALEHARAARSEATAAGDRVIALRAEVVEVAAFGQVAPEHELGVMRDRVAEIRKELETAGDEAALVHVLLVEAIAEFFLGHCDRARRIEESVLGMDVELDPLRRREILTGISVAAYFGSTPIDEALAIIDRLDPLAEGRLVSSLWLAQQRMALHAMAGRERESLEQLELADRLLSEIANPAIAVTRLQARGEGMVYLGRLEDAEAVFREGVEVLDSLGETGFNSTMTALLAGVLCRLGWFDEAAAFVEATDYLDMRAEAHATRGLVLHATGHDTEARAAYQRALDLYERKGAVTGVDRVRAAMATLSA